jgi:predicted oxidoreductase
MTDILAIDTEMIARAVGDALHSRVGPRRPMSDAEAAAALGCDERSIRAYRLANQSPKAFTLLRMFVVFGEEFANDVLALAHLHCQTLAEGEADELLLNRDTAHLLNEMADALADGHVDHLERRRIREKAKRVRVRLNAYIRNTEPHLRVVAASK